MASEVTPLRVERREADDPVVIDLLASYVAELEESMPGIDLARAAPPGPMDFTWPNGAFCVVFSGDVPIGCGALRRMSATAGEIRRMWVHPAYRRRGVAKVIVGTLEELARSLELHEIFLDTSRTLDAALALYAGAGFHEVNRYNDNEFADIWFAKSLVHTRMRP